MEAKKTQYNEAELQEFRCLIEDKLVKARKELDNLSEQLKELNENDDENKLNFEEGNSNYEREHISKMASRQQAFIRQLEYALMRIKNKTYGICTITGELIDKRRLMLVPHTTKSLNAKTSMVA